MRNGKAAVAAATILCATSSSAPAGAQSLGRAASPSVKQKLVLKARTASSEPALLAIELLQEIFQRIHEYPALALQNMHKARQNMIKQETAPSPPNGPTNIFLAIKPPVTVMNSQSFNQEHTRNSQIAMARGRAALFLDQRQTENFQSAAKKSPTVAAGLRQRPRRRL